MKIKSFLIACLLSIGFAVPNAQALVYWEDDPSVRVSARDLQATNGRDGPAIWEVLTGSTNYYVRRAYGASARSANYLLLRNTRDGVWHRGGYPDTNHVTVKVMNGDDRMSTCHVYPFRDRRSPDYFYTTCD